MDFLRLIEHHSQPRGRETRSCDTREGICAHLRVAFLRIVSYQPQQSPHFHGSVRLGIVGAKMGGLRDDPEFWRVQAKDAKKESRPEIAREYERIAQRVEERLNDLEKRAPAASTLRKVSMRKKKPGQKSA
jgi:hypothetical protein